MQLEEVGNKNLVIKDVKDKGSKVILTFNDDSKMKMSKLTYNNFALSEEKEIDEKLNKEINLFEQKVEISKYI